MNSISSSKQSQCVASHFVNNKNEKLHHIDNLTKLAKYYYHEEHKSPQMNEFAKSLKYITVYYQEIETGCRYQDSPRVNC